MDDGVLSIRWDTGYMNIVKDSFFPCLVDRFKKLLKVIDLDWKHDDSLKEELKVYFQERISANEKYLKTAGKKNEADQKAAKREIQRFERLLQILTKNIGGT